MDVEGLNDLIHRMRAYPVKLTAALAHTMATALLVLWENVPPYPPQPDDTEYIRTGTLGRTLGSSEAGGMLGRPDIYQIKKLGDEGLMGVFGTALDYGPYVIGDEDQAAQNSHWWTMRTIAERSSAKVLRLFEVLGDKLADFLARGTEPS